MHPRPSLPFGRHGDDAGTLWASLKKQHNEMTQTREPPNFNFS